MCCVMKVDSFLVPFCEKLVEKFSLLNLVLKESDNMWFLCMACAKFERNTLEKIKVFEKLQPEDRILFY